MEVIIDRENGDVKVYEVKTVVEEEDLYDAALEISLEEARKISKKQSWEKKFELKWTVSPFEEMQFKMENKSSFKK